VETIDTKPKNYKSATKGLQLSQKDHDPHLDHHYHQEGILIQSLGVSPQ
jgi:hypothetical protein